MLKRIYLTFDQIADAIDFESRMSYGDMTLEQEQLVAKLEYNEIVDVLNNMILNGRTKEKIMEYVHELWLDYEISDCTEYLVEQQLEFV